MIFKTSYILLLSKTLIFICLAAIFFIFYCTEVVNKFTERDTNLILSQENIKENKMNFPFITHCWKKKRDFLIIRSKVGGFLSLTVDGNEYFVG